MPLLRRVVPNPQMVGTHMAPAALCIRLAGIVVPTTTRHRPSKTKRHNNKATDGGHASVKPALSPARDKLIRDTLGYDMAAIDTLVDRITGKQRAEDIAASPASLRQAVKDVAAAVSAVSGSPPMRTVDTAMQCERSRALPDREDSPCTTNVPKRKAAQNVESVRDLVAAVFSALAAEPQDEAAELGVEGAMRALRQSLSSSLSLERTLPCALAAGDAWRAALEQANKEGLSWSLLTANTVQLMMELADDLAVYLNTVSINPTAGLEEVKQLAEVIDALWWHVGVPAMTANATADETRVNHRTTHSSLNYLLRFHWQQLSTHKSKAAPRVKQLSDALGQATALWMAEPASGVALLASLDRATAAATRVYKSHVAAQPGRTRSSHDSQEALQSRRETAIPLVALLARTALDVDTHLSIARASVRKELWCTPTRLDRHLAVSTTSRLASSKEPNVDLQAHAEPTEAQADTAVCMQARLTASHALHEVALDTVTRLSRYSASTEHDEQARLEHHNLRVLVGMVKHALYALLRRHYMETISNNKATDDVAFRLGVYTYTLHTFLLLSDAHQTVDNSTWWNRRRSTTARKGPLTCGVTLTQALDVVFFLHLYVANRWSDAHASARSSSDAHADLINNADHIAPLISSARVEDYIKEVLCDLQHNTAKQLWHLRNKGVLFFFSGLRRDGTFTQTDTIQKRQAQSVLGFVHAHVMHPSLLWMPLCQLQELVTVLGERPHLLAVSPPAAPPEQGDASTERDAAPRVSDAKTGVANGGKHYPVIGVGSRSVTLTRLHCYLVLRLFVVSNVLRACRTELLRDSTVRQPHQQEAPPLSRRASTRLRASAAHEPAAEPGRRQQRDWTARTVSLLLTQYPTLAAEVEGVPNSGDGHARALSRLESTVRYTLDRHLFVKAAELLQAHAAQSRSATDSAPHEKQKKALDDAVMDTALEDELASVELREVPNTGGDVKSEATVQAPAPSDPVRSRPVSFPAMLVLRWSRESVTAPLGFSVDADGCVRQVTADGTFHRAAMAALSTPELDEHALTGWKVESVNGQSVSGGRELATLMQKERQFLVRLKRPSVRQASPVVPL